MNDPSQPLRIGLDLVPLQTASAFQGIGRYIRELGQALLKQLSTEAPKMELMGLYVEKDIWISEPLDRALARDLKHLPKLRPAHVLALSRAARRAHCQLVHILEPWPALPPLGTPFLATCHDLLRLELPHLYSRHIPHLRKALLQARLTVFFRSARHVIADSGATSQKLLQLLAVPRERTSVAYPGIDPNRFHPRSSSEEVALLQRTWGLSPGYLLYVGTGDRRKRLPDLIEALAKAPAGRPLVIAGKIHPQQRLLLHQPLTLAPPGTVRLVGFVAEEHLPILYRHSLALVFPTLGEGFGLPIVEAMACGTPVVAFANSAIPEVAGDAAWLVPTGNFAEMVEAVKVLLENPHRREELAEKGKARAALFRWERTARVVLGVYRKILRLGE